MSIDPRPTRAAPDDDPYLWLEDVEGEDACAWADARSAETLAALAGMRLEADVAALLAIYDRPDRIPHVTRHGGLLYDVWRDAAHSRGLWRRTTMASYRSDEPDWDVLLDLDALAAVEDEDWVWGGASARPPQHDRALVRLSRGGSDAVVLREFGLGKRAFLAGGFALPEAKGGASWLDDDTLLLSAALGAGNATLAGHTRTVRLWPRGGDPATAPVLFEVPPERMSCWAGYDRDADRVTFVEQLDFFNTALWLGDRAGPTTRLDLPTDAWVTWHRSSLVVRPRTAWSVDGVTHALDTVLGIARDAFLAGSRAFRVLFAPERRTALHEVFWAGDDLIIAVLDDLRPSYLRAISGEDWRVEVIGGLPRIAAVDLWRLDADSLKSNGDLLLLAQTPVTPSVLSLLTPTLAAPTPLRRSPPTFDPGAAEVTRHEAVAPDGERIPYVQVGPAGEMGEAPVHTRGWRNALTMRENNRVWGAKAQSRQVAAFLVHHAVERTDAVGGLAWTLRGANSQDILCRERRRLRPSIFPSSLRPSRVRPSRINSPSPVLSIGHTGKSPDIGFAATVR